MGAGPRPPVPRRRSLSEVTPKNNIPMEMAYETVTALQQTCFPAKEMAAAIGQERAMVLTQERPETSIFDQPTITSGAQVEAFKQQKSAFQEENDETNTLASYNSDLEDLDDATLLKDITVGTCVPDRPCNNRPLQRGFPPMLVRQSPSDSTLRATAAPSTRGASFPGLFPRLDTQLPDLRQFWRKPEQTTPSFITTQGCMAPEQVITVLGGTL